MPSSETLQITVGIVALACAGASFLLYLAFSTGLLQTPGQSEAVKEAREAMAFAKARGAADAVAPDPTELLKAATAFIESLLKAGPSLWAMVAAVLFLLIASYAIQAPAIGDREQDPPAAEQQQPAG